MRALLAGAWAACVSLTVIGAPITPPKAATENWLPQPRSREPKDEVNPVADAPPSAFPDLVFAFPIWNGTDTPAEHQEKVDGTVQRMWPRLTGTRKLAIEATDDVPRKLLKSQLFQNVLEWRGHRAALDILGADPPFSSPSACLANMRGTVLELWAGQPKELTPWLKELVSLAKTEERYVRLRVEAGALKPYYLNHATRYRLKVEADLWKAQNAPAQPAPARAAKADDKRVKAPGGDWLADQKRPPSLFPEIAPPEYRCDGWGSIAGIRAMTRFAQSCPHLSGQIGLTINEADTTIQKLLKARLHQGAREIWAHRVERMFVGFDPSNFAIRYECIDDMLATAAELLERRPEELRPWLEELLVEAKEWERAVQLRVEASAMRPRDANAATRSRLKVETALWKAKNAK